MRRFDIELDELEAICIQVNRQGKAPVLFLFVYRPPESKQCWVDTFEIVLENLDNSLHEFYILGDININYFPLC